MSPQALISVSRQTQRVEAGTHSPPPTRVDRFLFEAKTFAFRVRRAVENLLHPMPRHERSNGGGAAMPVAIAESRSFLWTSATNAEMAYQLGKVQNLRAAARRLDGLFIPSGEVFSFWRQVGRPSARAGFATGRMLREGCIVPSTGGGLCQLSNALYQAALTAGCEIVERHAHSRIVPGSAAALGQDATVAWNYVDLRFRPRVDMELRVELTRDELVVRLLGRTPRRVLEKLRPPSHAELPPAASDCLSCGQTACRDNQRAAAIVSAPGTRARTAFLLDENWPEFQRHLLKTRAAKDALFIPLDGAHWGQPRYTWPVRGLDEVHEAVWPTLVRAWRARRLAAQGAARQLAMLDGAEALAQSYGQRIPVAATHLVVAQSLLPFLWRDGHLGGRTFSVLMTRLPIRSLERRLDEAAALHPQRVSLKDFRAPHGVTEAETEALAAASELVTPHTAIAAEFGTRSRRLDWIGPRPALAPAPPPPAFAIGFAGPVAARRGAYEVRDAARQLGCRVIYSGADLEGPGFWRDIPVERARPGWDWLSSISVLAAPAIVESRPNAALAALHAGVPVIATHACGLPAAAGLTLINEPHLLLETLHSPLCRT